MPIETLMAQHDGAEPARAAIFREPRSFFVVTHRRIPSRGRNLRPGDTHRRNDRRPAWAAVETKARKRRRVAMAMNESSDAAVAALNP